MSVDSLEALENVESRIATVRDRLTTLRDLFQNNSTVDAGQDTVATGGNAGTLNGGTSVSIPDGALLRINPLNGNTDVVYVDASGSTSSSDSYELAPDDDPIRLKVDDVNDVDIQPSTGGEGVSWIVEQ